MRRVLVVGNGAAGIACVQEILKLGSEFQITLCAASLAPGESSTSKLDQSQLAWLRRNAVDVRDTGCVEAISRHANVVRLCDGSRATFDTLVLAAGDSNPTLGRAARLHVRTGVVVNDYMETSDAHVYAMGEGAEHRGRMYSDEENVQQQARVLAAHLLDTPVRPAFEPKTPRKVMTYAASPGASADSEPPSEDRRPARLSLPALAGAV